MLTACLAVLEYSRAGPVIASTLHPQLQRGVFRCRLPAIDFSRSTEGDLTVPSTLADDFRIRLTYEAKLRGVTIIPSASRHSHTLCKLWPLSSAALISGQSARICAAFVGAFFSRNAARRARALDVPACREF
jgi:hypothetical protein